MHCAICAHPFWSLSLSLRFVEHVNCLRNARSGEHVCFSFWGLLKKRGCTVLSAHTPSEVSLSPIVLWSTLIVWETRVLGSTFVSVFEVCLKKEGALYYLQTPLRKPLSLSLPFSRFVLWSTIIVWETCVLWNLRMNDLIRFTLQSAKRGALGMRG